jgi:Nuclease-related domain
VTSKLPDAAQTDRVMNLRYSGVCTSCGQGIPKGARAMYSPSTHSVRHVTCPVPDHGTAGGSAMREYERRRARDTAKIEARKDNVRAVFGDGVMGKIATFLAVDDNPRRSTSVWGQGAVGEEKVAARLAALAEVGVCTLHDRRIPGTRANIDHLVVTPWGVWVVDAKRYINKRPTYEVYGGLFSPRREELRVGGRKADHLVDGVLWQVERVQAVLEGAAPVTGLLCFVEADWPLIGRSFTVRGVRVCWPARLAKTLLKTEEPVLDIEAVSWRLAAKFPAA